MYANSCSLQLASGVACAAAAAAGVDVLGTWGAGSSGEGQLEEARAAALEAVQRCCSDKDDARKAAAKVGNTVCVQVLLLLSVV